MWRRCDEITSSFASPFVLLIQPTTITSSVLLFTSCSSLIDANRFRLARFVRLPVDEPLTWLLVGVMLANSGELGDVNAGDGGIDDLGEWLGDAIGDGQPHVGQLKVCDKTDAVSPLLVLAVIR